jgi:citronellol/citronellal dehydrogenase
VTLAKALWWKNVVDTPMKRYDLVQGVNSRGSFACVRAVLPYMIKQRSGHIITMSPPIELEHMEGKVGYLMSKYGMTILAMGLAEVSNNCSISAFLVESIW